MDRSPPQPRDLAGSSTSTNPSRFDAAYLPRLSQLGPSGLTSRLDQLTASDTDQQIVTSQLQPSSDLNPNRRIIKRARGLLDGDQECPIDTPSSKRRRPRIGGQGVQTATVQIAQPTVRRLRDPRLSTLASTILPEEFSHFQDIYRNRGTNPPPQSSVPSPAPDPVLDLHSAGEIDHAMENEDDDVEFVGSRLAIDATGNSQARRPPATPQSRPAAPAQPALQASSSSPGLAPFSSPSLGFFDSSPLPATLQASQLDHLRQPLPSLGMPRYAADVGDIATRNGSRPNIIAPAQIPPIASQNNEDVRFSTILSITQSLSVLDQIMPTHWVRRGIALHEDLRSWLTTDMQRPSAGTNDAIRNCTCAVEVPKKFYFAGCRHMACADCARKSSRCCDRDQSMVLCYRPEGSECPICEDTNLILIFKCGHTMCQPCYLRLASQPGNKLCPQCRSDLGFGAVARFNPA